MLDKIVESCQYLLHNFPDADYVRSYLNSRLNISSQELFQFGYFPPINNISCLTDLIGEDALYNAGLLVPSYINNIYDPQYANENSNIMKLNYSYFEDFQLIMPFKNAYGKSVGLVGRTMLSDDDMKSKNISKYKNTKQSEFFKKGNFLFGLYENKKYILEQNSVFIVEGQFDVIKAVERGFKNIVALGNSNMTVYQFTLICRYTNNIFLLLDNDEAGKKGRKKIVNQFGKFANIQNFYIPESYKDIDEYLTKSGDTSLQLTIK